MAKPVKTQWDFGELFAEESLKKPEPIESATPPNPAPQPAKISRKVFSVSDLTWQIRQLLETQVGRVWVMGEVTNLRAQNSGHIYFTLKDANAQLGCVLFRGEIQVDRSLLQDGRKVTVGGEVTVYEPRGQYQLRVTAAELQGVGALQVAFEKLKQKLKAEGLFAQERKRALPKYPQRIGLVTSPTSAAIRDVVHVIERRNPGLEIILAACRVQGDGAAEEIAAAIRLLNEFDLGLELILVTRGGGSLEDLWAFNEEAVARAIFESALPVVSAVGHEIDFTISDFVADLRAATPSAAAEIITEGVFSRCQFLAEARGRLLGLVEQRLEEKRDLLAQTRQRLARMHPRRRFNDWLQRLDDLQSTLVRCAKKGTQLHRTQWRNVVARLARVRPAVVIRQQGEVLRQEKERLHEQVRHQVERRRNHLKTLQARLRLLGPEQVLARGYSITMEAESGKILREAKKVKRGQRLKTRLKDGQVRSVVEE